MKTFAALLPLAWCAAAGAATPAEIDSLIAAARTAPAEFAADALLRLAALDQIAARRKMELAERAFDRAAEAQQPYKKQSALASGQGPVHFLNRAYQQGLDGLSLQLRAVDLMLAADPRQARALFARIPRLKLPRITCADFLVYDVERFYRVLAAVAERGFTDQEKAAGDSLRLLQLSAGAVDSPVEAGPMADVIAGSGLSDTDFTALVAAFGGALGKISGDDRSFTASYRLGPHIESLVKECQRRKVNPLPLLESYRLYLVVNLSAARCSDNDRIQGGGQSFGIVTGPASPGQDGDMAGFFNARLRMPPLQAIQEIESTPSRLEGVATGLRSCQDDPCKKIAGLYQELIVGPSGLVVRPAERTGAEWQGKARALLAAIQSWEPGSYPAAEYFRDKTGIYSDLLNLTPAGPSRDAALHGELDFLLRSRPQAANRIEWFLPLNALLARIALDPGGFGAFGEELRRSSDPVVALYARLESAAPRPADRLIGLL